MLPFTVSGDFLPTADAGLGWVTVKMTCFADDCT